MQSIASELLEAYAFKSLIYGAASLAFSPAGVRVIVSILPAPFATLVTAGG